MCYSKTLHFNDAVFSKSTRRKRIGNIEQWIDNDLYLVANGICTFILIEHHQAGVKRTVTLILVNNCVQCIFYRRISIAKEPFVSYPPVELFENIV